MSNINAIVNADPPRSLAEALQNWPQRDRIHPSPGDWRDEIFYFLLPDRFSNGRERSDRLLNADLSTAAGLARVRELRGAGWRWDRWQQSGAERFQGGTIAGIRSKLPYLAELGVTTLWLGPIFRQRVEENTYHGYGVQDFLDIDPRFGTRRDLIELVEEAHSARYGMRVVLDVIFNHSGCNWLYDTGVGNIFQPPYRWDGYSPIWQRNGYGASIFSTDQTLGRDDAVWPRELQGARHYLRAGSGDLGAGDINDEGAEHKRTDFCSLRKFNLFDDVTLGGLVLAYHYWIALADIDGFRIDTLKHVTFEQARTFCNAVKEYAEALGKDDFFLVAEVAGGNSAQDRYLDITGRNLNACLDIGEQREITCNVGKGLAPATTFFAGFNPYDAGMGSHRNWGSQHLGISNDHDHVFGPKVRLAADAASTHQGAAVAAVQLFTLGIPCLYYGTEQGLASGAEPDQRQYLSNWGGHDCLLREAMFGPEHPLASGWAGTQAEVDTALPGFGPHGTAGWHVFNPGHPLYRRISQLAAVRRDFKPLRRGRQYQRQISCLGSPFVFAGSGELIAWSRVFDDQEVLVVVNPHGVEVRGGKVAVDCRLTGTDGLQVVAQTDPDAPAARQAGAWVETVRGEDGWCSVALDGWLLGPSETMVLANRAAVDAAGYQWSAASSPS